MYGLVLNVDNVVQVERLALHGFITEEITIHVPIKKLYYKNIKERWIANHGFLYFRDFPNILKQFFKLKDAPFKTTEDFAQNLKTWLLE